MKREPISLEQYKITAINCLGEIGARGKGRISLLPDTPLIPIDRVKYPVKIRPIPNNEGLELLAQVINAKSWDDIKTVIRRLYMYGYDFITYTVQTPRAPMELVILKTPDQRLIINAVDYARTKERVVYYTSFIITQRMLILLIAGNLA